MPRLRRRWPRQRRAFRFIVPAGRRGRGPGCADPAGRPRRDNPHSPPEARAEASPGPSLQRPSAHAAPEPRRERGVHAAGGGRSERTAGRRGAARQLPVRLCEARGARGRRRPPGPSLPPSLPRPPPRSARPAPPRPRDQPPAPARARALPLALPRRPLPAPGRGARQGRWECARSPEVATSQVAGRAGAQGLRAERRRDSGSAGNLGSGRCPCPPAWPSSELAAGVRSHPGSASPRFRDPLRGRAPPSSGLRAERAGSACSSPPRLLHGRAAGACAGRAAASGGRS